MMINPQKYHPVSSMKELQKEYWKQDWLLKELIRIDRMFEECEDLFSHEININAELRHTYNLALITYEMPKNVILSVADDVSDRIADLIEDMM